jgi:hypothetical protein
MELNNRIPTKYIIGITMVVGLNSNGSQPLMLHRMILHVSRELNDNDPLDTLLKPHMRFSSQNEASLKLRWLMLIIHES